MASDLALKTGVSRSDFHTGVTFKRPRLARQHLCPPRRGPRGAWPRPCVVRRPSRVVPAPAGYGCAPRAVRGVRAAPEPWLSPRRERPWSPPSPLWWSADRSLSPRAEDQSRSLPLRSAIRFLLWVGCGVCGGLEGGGRARTARSLTCADAARAIVKVARPRAMSPTAAKQCPRVVCGRRGRREVLRDPCLCGRF